MTITEDGSFDPDTKAVILDAMIEDAKARFGEDLNDSQLAPIRFFYDPIAERLAEAQIDLADILSSTQIDNASEAALDAVVQKIGVVRNSGKRSIGQVRFSRDNPATVDYTIHDGTQVQTGGFDPIVFETTTEATLPSGASQVDVNIQAVEIGSGGNVAPNTITQMKTSVTGIEEVTNPAVTEGGLDRESDPELRERAKVELSEGSRSSAPAIIRGLKQVAGVKSVSLFVNDDPDPDVDGRDPNSFEAVVEGGQTQDIADQLVELKAAGDGTVGGFAGAEQTGSGTLPNGQALPVSWSEPTQRQVYIDVDITTTDDYEGDTAVRDSIVKYIGGLRSSGSLTSGTLGAGDTVLTGEIEFAVRQVLGVYDVTSLKVGLSANPTGTTNVELGDTEVPTADAVDGSITFTKSEL
jgi:hypothetical protein